MENLKPINTEEWQDANPQTGKKGSIPSAETFKQPIEELVNLILAGGLEPKGDDLTQVKQAVSAMIAEAITSIDVTTFAEKRQFEVVATLPAVLEPDVFYFVHEVV